MMSYQVVCDEVRHWAETYEGPPLHACLCDPPYHLISDTRNGSPRQPGTGPYGRHTLSTKGFMGKEWDGGAIAFQPETWKGLAAHLLPGAFGFAFASSRGWHRLACAIEDAGLILHPSIWLWTYGSGFPKSTRIKGSEVFSGHRYGLQAIKPAAEPIICFQTPYAGRPVDSITTHGAGAFWIDGGRITAQDFDPKERTGATKLMDERPWNRKQLATELPKTIEGHMLGRWPANFALTHHPDCNGVCADGCPVQRLDLQAGERRSCSGRGFQRHCDQNRLTYGNFEGTPAEGYYGDTGNASRFFHTSDWSLEVAEQLAQADPVRYCAKASRKERDAGLDGMPLHRGGTMDGGHVVSEGRTAPKTGRVLVRNNHPTVKPLSLTRWLATMLLPPAAYAPRRLLVPFAGSGSEICGAALAGWDDVLGIEQDESYVQLARARISHWTGWKPPGAQVPIADQPQGQMPLFHSGE